MQKSFSEIVSLPGTELIRMIEREPLLVTHDGEPQFVAQSLDSFEAMVRRIRQLESSTKQTHNRPRGRLIFFRR